MANNPVVIEDIENIVMEESIEWQKLKGKTVAVTGATGLLGRLLVFSLLHANKTKQLGVKVLAFVRNREKANVIYADWMCDELEFVVQDIMNPVPEEFHADFLIHGASITTSKLMVEKPVETIMTAISGTKNMLDFAARCKMQGAVYLSSMEVYGVVEENQKEVRETDLGFIDPLLVRSSYSEGKRITECLCAAYASEHEVNIKIARLAQTFGAGIDKNENRVFAQFARSVMHGEDIVLHTKGEKANCYCYTGDAVSGILTLLTKGEKGQAYNVANMDTFCSIKEMAEVFVRVGDGAKSKLVFDIPKDVSKFGYAPSSIMRLNSEKLLQLGWSPKVTMEGMAGRLMRSMAYEEEMAG